MCEAHATLKVRIMIGALLITLGSVSSFAAGKKKPQPVPPDIGPSISDGKRVVSIAPVEGVTIEMPDQKFYNFGDNFQNRLQTKLGETNRYVVVTQTPVQALAAKSDEPGYVWDSTFVPAATVRIFVDALNFTTGSRGERMFYGFDERFRTQFNSGDHDAIANEFPLRSISFDPNWFDRTFDSRGMDPFGSLAGLDLGDGLKIDVIFAWLAVKYAIYKTQINLRVEIDAPLAGRYEYRTVQVKQQGFYFDLAGAYAGYSAGIRVARRDAMLRAFNNALAGALDSVTNAIGELPLTGRIDAVLPDGVLLIGTGRDSEIRPGTRYQVMDAPGVLIEITECQTLGSVGRVVAGDPAAATVGKILREVTASARAAHVVKASDKQGPDLVAAESIDLPWQNLPKSDFKDGEVPAVNYTVAFAQSIAGIVLLPYRIWRYFMYDRPYAKEADGGDGGDPSGAPYNYNKPIPPPTLQDWVDELSQEPFARKIGLVDGPVPPAPKAPPVVAVIDTGVDYNHSALHDNLWLNPSPTTDTRGFQDRYGWDFVSGDSRPADDGYHGTQVASLVTGVSPNVRIMPLKAFNPWGITSSAALYGAFVYAVDHGARVILCGWATRQDSLAIKRGVEYARAHGVLVVASAGDRGDDLDQNPSYPAAYAAGYDNVVTVTGVDSSDVLVTVKGLYANFGSNSVTLAAPGKDILMAEPRNGRKTETTAAAAAALVAGALSRILTVSPQFTYGQAIAQLKADADVVPGLQGKVQGGLRLHVR